MNIYCFGDSHTRYFKRSNTLAWASVLSRTTPTVTACDYTAASAKGLAAGDSSRFAYRSFKRDYDKFAPDFVCVGYGQVDAEVGFYYRKYAKNFTGSAEADLSSVYDGYIKRVEETLKMRPLVFKGPNPSTLRIETQLLNNVYQRLVARMTNSEQRAAIWAEMQSSPPEVAEHGRINAMAAEMLRAKVEAAGHIYFDIRSEVEDPSAPGLARWEHVPADSDVHLCDSFHVRRAHAERLFTVFEGLAVTRIAE